MRYSPFTHLARSSSLQRSLQNGRHWCSTGWVRQYAHLCTASTRTLYPSGELGASGATLRLRASGFRHRSAAGVSPAALGLGRWTLDSRLGGLSLAAHACCLLPTAYVPGRRLPVGVNTTLTRLKPRRNAGRLRCRRAHMDQFLIVAGLIAIALAFDFINGFHDAANSIATVVSTRVLSPGWAVVWAAFFNFVAAFAFGTAVAKTIGSGLVDVTKIDNTVIFGALHGAIDWDLI